MNKVNFVNGLQLLKGFYMNWQLDIKNNMLLDIWYDALKQLNDEQYAYVIKTYCANNRYAPNSPFDLLDVIPKEYSLDEACEIINDICIRCKEKEIRLNSLLKYKGIYKIAMPIINNYSKEEDSFGNDCIGYYILRPFKRKYQEYLNSFKVVKISNQLQNNNNLLLGE